MLGVRLLGGECVTTETRHFSTGRLARGLVGAYNDRPHGDSKVPPYSVKAQLGLMRSALAGVHCDQREVRVQQYSAVLAQLLSQTVAATEHYVGPGVTPGRATLGRSTRMQ